MGIKVDTGPLSLTDPHCYFETGSFLLIWLANESEGPTCLLTPGTGFTGVQAHTWIFRGFWGPELRSLFLLVKY